MKLKPQMRRAILKSADCTQNNIAIEVVPGIALAPRIVGESAHYETKTGLRISHPNAYAKKGWSAMRYCASTRHVEVGALWIEHTPAAAALSPAEIEQAFNAGVFWEYAEVAR